MGQYYKFCALNSRKKNYPNKDKIRATMRAWDFNNGSKLMEFSYIRNEFMSVVENLINIDNKDGWLAGSNILFAGDYADDEPYKYKGEMVNIYGLAGMLEEEKGLGITRSKAPKPKHYRYLINETKRVFFDMDRVKPFHREVSDGTICELRVHPLSILCNDGCIKGCSRGCGDYSVEHREVGAWRRDIVVTSDNRPDENIYREVFYNFYDKW